ALSGTARLGEIAPPFWTQIACASGVTSHFMSSRACGVSLNMPNRSPADSTAPAFLGAMSGKGKASKSWPGLRLAKPLVMKVVMKLAWWCRNAFGGLWKSGLAASPKLVDRTAALPPKVIFGSLTISPQACQAFLMPSELHLTLPCAQPSYVSAPDWRRTMSSIQSVPGQPEAAPLSSPMLHGVVPVPAIFWASALRASQVFGTW